MSNGTRITSPPRRAIASSFARGAWSGAIFDGRELWLLDPADAVRGQLARPEAKYAGPVLYRFRDVRLPALFDEVHEPPERDDAYAAFASHLAAKAAGATKQLRLTVVADTEYQSLHGANAAAVATARVNVIDGIYSSQLQVEIAIGNYSPLASNGTLTTANGNDLLGVFRTFMTQPGQTIPKGHLNHLFSGKDFGANVKGAVVDMLKEGLGAPTKIIFRPQKAEYDKHIIEVH